MGYRDAVAIGSSMLLVALLAPRAHAQDAATGDGPRLSWPQARSEAGWGHAATTAAFAVGALGVAVGLRSPEEPRWLGGILFDDGARRGLRLGQSARPAGAATSDALLLTTAAWPVAVDALLVALALDRNPRVAGQMLAVDAQSFAVTTLLVALAKRLAGRGRPFVDADDDVHAEDVGDGRATQSFFSGHTAMAFTGAGLLCSQHRALGLYGDRRADRATCGTALALASLTGALRVMADQHWLSDVVVGAAIGLLSGWLLPRSLDLRGRRRGEPLD